MAQVVKNPSANSGDIRGVSLIPGFWKSPGEGNEHPLQYFCLENPMDRAAWQATAHGVARSQTWLKWLSKHSTQSVSCQLNQTKPKNLARKKEKVFLPYNCMVGLRKLVRLPEEGRDLHSWRQWFLSLDPFIPWASFYCFSHCTRCHEKKKKHINKQNFHGLCSLSLQPIYYVNTPESIAVQIFSY